MIQVNILKEKWRDLAVVSKQTQSLKINLVLYSKEIIVSQNENFPSKSICKMGLAQDFTTTAETHLVTLA